MKDIQPGGHGFNVFVKVLKADSNKLPSGRNVVTCQVGDGTALAQASFVDPPADLLKPGAVIAIRNGRSQVIKEQIELRIDQ